MVPQGDATHQDTMEDRAKFWSELWQRDKDQAEEFQQAMARLRKEAKRKEHHMPEI